VWEITGAEFTNQGVHTADGISIRFPRVTRIRPDKNWSTATSLNELRELFRKKPESVDFSLILGMSADVESSPRKKLPNSDRFPAKKFARKGGSSPDEPSTSSKVARESPDTLEIKKEPSKITAESFEKREIKEETESPSPIRVKKEREAAIGENIPRERLSNSNRSPKKLENARKRRSSLNEPSTSWQIREESPDVPEVKGKPSGVAVGAVKKRKEEKCNEKSDVVHVQSDRKRLKTMKETRNPSPIKAERESEEERKNHYVNRFAGRTDSGEFSEDSGDADAFNSDVEDSVSNDVLRFTLTINLPLYVVYRVRNGRLKTPENSSHFFSSLHRKILCRDSVTCCGMCGRVSRRTSTRAGGRMREGC